MEGNSDTKNLCVLCASETNPIFGETLSDKLALCQLDGEFGLWRVSEVQAVIAVLTR